MDGRIRSFWVIDGKGSKARDSEFVCFRQILVLALVYIIFII